MGLEEEWLRYHRLLGLDRKPSGSPLTVDTSLAALELAAAGSGLAVVLRGFAQSPHMAGRVQLAFAPELPQEQAHFILSREGGGPIRPEAAIFRDWLFDEFKPAET